jgi:hypothetical protein
MVTQPVLETKRLNAAAIRWRPGAGGGLPTPQNTRQASAYRRRSKNRRVMVVRHAPRRPLPSTGTLCYQQSGPDGGSSNGRTADSDSASLGSNPSPPANILRDLQAPCRGSGFSGYHRGIPRPDLAGRGGIRMAGRPGSRAGCVGARSAALGKSAAPLRNSISLVAVWRALSQVRRQNARSERP